MTSHRFDAVDALRGFAILWMTLFHFCFDLNHFGFIQQDFYQQDFWTVQRTCILSLFLFCAGLGQAIAVGQGQSWQRFAKRWAQVVGAAALVSVGSRLMFPNSWIYFGVLHGIAVMLLLARLVAGWGAALWVVGAVAIALGLSASTVHATSPTLDFLNAPQWNWLGLISRKPVTEDYVPLLPWFGVLCWGLATGNWVVRRYAKGLDQWGALAPKPLAILGRWSLTWYLLHQPVLLAVLGLFAAG